MERYQGIVALDGGSLEDVAHTYFQQSEQIPTLVRLAVAEHSVRGAGRPALARRRRLMQFLPAHGQSVMADLPGDGNFDNPETADPDFVEDDKWTTTRAYLSTVADDELADPDLSPNAAVPAVQRAGRARVRAGGARGALHLLGRAHRRHAAPQFLRRRAGRDGRSMAKSKWSASSARPTTTSSRTSSRMSVHCDPLGWCARMVSETDVYRRAAEWAGLAFADVVPEQFTAPAKADAIDGLSRSTRFSVTRDDATIELVAPDFERMLVYRWAVLRSPRIGANVLVVPPNALRQWLTATHARILSDEARQRLARHWPFASAHLDLPKASRIIFVAALAMLVAVAALAALLGWPVLSALGLILVLFPALVRLAAIAMSNRPSRADQQKLPALAAGLLDPRTAAR
jgi:hypothetical protein